MGTKDMYPIHTGYLTKSPPETRVSGFKRWMKRWFVLWEDKSLQYFKQRGDPKPKKTIDLSHCEFLDTNLMDKRFDHIFSIRVHAEGGKDNGRTYFLAADTSYEMNKWVENICKLCDFKATESNNNNNTDKIIRHQAPLDNEVPVSKTKRGDSFIEPADSGHDSDNSDLVAVKIITPEPYDDIPPPRPSKDENQQSAPSDYDDVPPPRAINEQYDVPPQHSPKRSPVRQRNSCPLDTSSSDSSLHSIKRSSDGSDIYQNFDGSSSQPTYDVPPSQPKYYPSSQPTYDVPPSNNSRYSSGSSSEDGNGIYDVPPPQPPYDIVPAPISAKIPSTMPGMVRVAYNTTGESERYHGRFGLQNTNNHSTLPPANAEPQSVYDIVPSHHESSEPFEPSNYDYVPPPKPLNEDSIDGRQNGIKPYVNIVPGGYAKPLPSAPGEPQRDSGTGLDDEIYDVPPTQPGSPPSVDRRTKPDMAPRVDRTSKPNLRGREYVNLQGEVRRSTTVKENSNRPFLKGGNVQRSKSAAAADYEGDAGYLYMESPKRTESSTRYSKKERKPSIPEDDEAYEFMCIQKKNEQDQVYQNCDRQNRESSPDRTTPPLRGHYQHITVVCQRDAPAITQRSPKTQYTTIDLEKTKGFQKTREEAEKGQ